jgi:hypothetical protein
MRTLTLSLILLTGCGPIPVQISKQSQEQTQRTSQEVAQDVAQETAQQSSHASESKQGTNSMPVIIICNSNNSPRATCATPREGGALNDVVDSNLRSKTK